MLKELSKSDWLSMLGISEKLIPKVLLLRGTRNLKIQYAKHKSFFSNIFEVESPNSVLEDVFIGDVEGIPIRYASVYGAPMASEVTHVFGVLGTSLVIQTGCCGALGDGFLAGDLIYATSAYCGEGASQYYLKEVSIVDASDDLLKNIKKEKLNKIIKAHMGPIFTTSVLFAERKKELENWYNKGYVAVDMETASTFAVARYFRMKRASILFAFDNPREGSHILLKESEKDNHRKYGESEMIRLALKIAVKYGETIGR